MNTYHYVKSFQAIRGRMTDKQIGMLRFHYQAQNHTATMTEIAHSVGYPDYNTANLHYGAVGRMLAEEMGWTPQEESPWLSALVDFHRQNASEEWQLTLHPTVVKALEQLGWF